MNKVYCVCLILTFGLTANAKIYKCVVNSLPGFVSVTTFDSSAPLLSQSMIQYNPDGSILSKKNTTYLAAHEICSTNINFESECNTQEKESELGYSYSFKCPSKHITGSFYVDENGWANFDCESPTMKDRTMADDCVAQ